MKGVETTLHVMVSRTSARNTREAHPPPNRRRAVVLFLTIVALTVYSMFALNPGTPDKCTSWVGGSG